MPVALPLPSSTSKTDINVLFSPQTLTVHVQNCASPRYTAARLWGSIVPGSSFWTWDAHGAHAYGLLTLHLEKQHAGTRWPHVFDLTTSSSGEPEVAETLDPSELYTIRESLEKYTAELREGGGAATGLATRSSLTDGEVDDEVDATVGIETCITWIKGTTTTTTDDDDDDEPEWAREDWDVPFNVLSTPLPGIGGGGSEISMVIKHTIDGLFFVLSSNEEGQTSGRPVWTLPNTPKTKIQHAFRSRFCRTRYPCHHRCWRRPPGRCRKGRPHLHPQSINGGRRRRYSIQFQP
jgi:hypothetical protein